MISEISNIDLSYIDPEVENSSYRRYFNRDTYRLELPANIISSLPIKKINVESLLHLMRSSLYVPVAFYKDTGIPIVKREVAYDDKYRYVLNTVDESEEIR